MACAVGGAGEPASIAARGSGDGLLERVTAVATAGHVLDFDDTYLPGLAHLSAPTAPAALVLGAERGASAGEVLDAYAAGFEAMGSMARAAHPALYDGGRHPTAVCGSLGAAVASARLMGLDLEAERTAAALALLGAGGLRSSFGSAGKSLQVGMAAADGVHSARLAEAGVRLDLGRIAAGPAGFEEGFGAAFSQCDDRSAVAENWIKAYPCCLQTHGAIDAALEVRAAGEEPRSGIEIVVHPVSLMAAAIGTPADGLEAKFSIGYVTAFTLLRGAPSTADFAELDPGALDLSRESIEVRPDPALGESEAVLLVDGSERARIAAALGSPARPMSDSALAAKVYSLAGERLKELLDDPGRGAADLAAVIPGALG